MGNERIRVVFISDTHTRHEKIDIPDGDLLCFTGDFMSSGYREYEVKSFIGWLKTISPRFKHIVVIAGNHDRYCESFPEEMRNRFQECHGDNIWYLYNETIELDFGERGKLKITGTPAQPYFCNWAFNVRNSDELYSIYSDVIGEDIDILLSHCPPYGFLDRSHRLNMFNPTGEKNLGSEELTRRISELKNPPRYVCFGHIHGDGGKTIEENGVTYINASVCDEDYNPYNPVVTLDMEGRK